MAWKAPIGTPYWWRILAYSQASWTAPVIVPTRSAQVMAIAKADQRVRRSLVSGRGWPGVRAGGAGPGPATERGRSMCADACGGWTVAGLEAGGRLASKSPEVEAGAAAGIAPVSCAACGKRCDPRTPRG